MLSRYSQTPPTIPGSDIVVNSLIQNSSTDNVPIQGSYTNWKLNASWLIDFNVDQPSGLPQDENFYIGKTALLINQYDPVRNGLYVISENDWLRSSDLAEGSSASSCIVVVSVQITQIYICTNNPGEDIVGVNGLTFQLCTSTNTSGTSGPEGGIIIKNVSFNAIETSKYLTYTQNNDNATNALTIGGSDFQNADVNITTSRSNSLNITAFRDLGVYSDRNITMNAYDLTITQNTKNDVIFQTGANTANNDLNVTASNLNFNVNPGQVDITTGSSNINTYLDGSRIKLTKTSYSITYPATTLQITSKQGNITINSITLGTNLIYSFGNSIQRTDLIKSDSIIQADIVSYAGTGTPKVYVNITNGYVTFRIQNIDHVSPLSGNLVMTYVIF
jgi:hypothetical protein